MASSWNFATVSIAIVLLGSIAFGITGNSYCLIQTIRFREKIDLWYLYISIIGAGMGCSIVLASSELSTLFYTITDVNDFSNYGAWDVIQLFFYYVCYCCACISIVELAVLDKLAYVSNSRRNSSHVIEYLCVSVQWLIGIIVGAFAVSGMSEFILWSHQFNSTHTSTDHNATNFIQDPENNSAISTTVIIECFNIILGITVVITQLSQTYSAIKNEQQGIVKEPIASLFVEYWDFLNEDTRRPTENIHSNNIVITNNRVSEVNPDGGTINSTHFRFSLNNSKSDNAGMMMQAPPSTADSNMALCSPSLASCSEYTYKRTKASVAETLRKRLGSDFDMSEVSFDISLPGAVEDRESERPSLHSRVTEKHSQVSASVKSVKSKKSSISVLSTNEHDRSSQVSVNHKGMSLSIRSGPSIQTTPQICTASQIYTIEEDDSIEAMTIKHSMNQNYPTQKIHQ